MTSDQDPWLPLIEYSTKYQVSVSTLRRRIRGHSVKFKLNDGKYFLLDEPLSLQPAGRRGLDFLESEELAESPNHDAMLDESQKIQSSPTIGESVQTLLEELKRAYALILQEKEEQICQLREEISDLRTLVRVLETENERANRR